MKNSKNSKAKYYQKKSKVRLQKRKKNRERYKDLLQEEKNKNRQYCQKPQKNLLEGKKQKLVENRKKHFRIWKNKNASKINSD